MHRCMALEGTFPKPLTEEMRYRVLLVNYHHTDNMADMPLLFKRAGCRVDVYCGRRSWLLKNSYWNVWHKAPREHQAFVDGLVACVQQNTYDWVVMTDDYALRLVHDFVRDDVVAAKIFPLVGLEHKALLGSKVALSTLSKHFNIATPLFAVWDGIADVGALAQSVGYPLVLKVDRSGGGTGVFYCADENALIQTIATLPEQQKTNLLLQRYIDGEIISSEVLFHKGVLLACTYTKTLFAFLNGFGISSFRHYLPPPPAFEAVLRDIGAKFGIDGFCNSTFMLEAGTYYLIEADLRPHPWFILSRFAGVDFSRAIVHYLEGVHVYTSQPAVPGMPYIEVRHFLREINRALDTWDVMELLRWVGNADERWRFVPLHDSRVLRATLLGIIKKRIARLIPRKMRLMLDRTA